MNTLTILCPKSCIDKVHEFCTRAGYGAPHTIATAVLGAQLEITHEQLPAARDLERGLNAAIRKARGTIRIIAGTAPVYVKKEGGAE